MALIVENGTRVANADSYAARTDADSYHAARGNTAWAAASEDDRDAALREATAWLDATYKQSWQGDRVDADQSLDWPRFDVYTPDGFLVGSDEIPRDLKHATFEAALRALDGDLDPDLARGGRVKRQKLGPLEQEFFENAPGQKSYPRVENLVRWMLTGTSNAQVRLERA